MKTTTGSDWDLQFRTLDPMGIGPLTYAIGAYSGGRVLVGRDGSGICAILLGDDDETLKEELEVMFPERALRNFMMPELSAVVARLDHGDQRTPLKIVARGTPFQQEVWTALSQIPKGQTRSYREVAAAIGMPRAHRAVAQACAANSLAVGIPCHRVVRSDGSSGGYRWGDARKRALLEQERPR